MISRRSLLYLAGLSALTGPECHSAPTPPEDSDVYVAYLNEASAEVEKPAGLVIHPQSLTASTGEPGWPHTRRDIEARLPGIGAYTAASALAQFRTVKPVILPLGSISARLKIIQPMASDITEVFQTEDSLTIQWEAFRRKFNGATTLIRFSAVGYSPNFDEAIFLVTFSCGGLCGHGEIVSMRRTSGRWRIFKSERLWVS